MVDLVSDVVYSHKGEVDELEVKWEREEDN